MRRARHRQTGFPILLIAVASMAVPAMAASSRGVSQEELEARLGRETNVVKKVRIEIQIGRLVLGQAAGAFDHDQPEPGAKQLANYLHWMGQAWDQLKSSGADASRHPQGFKELDIALREDARTIEELRRRTPYNDRTEIERVAREIGALHTKVLAALFPGGRLEEDTPPARPVPPAGASPTPGGNDR